MATPTPPHRPLLRRFLVYLAVTATLLLGGYLALEYNDFEASLGREQAADRVRLSLAGGHVVSEAARAMQWVRIAVELPALRRHLDDPGPGTLHQAEAGLLNLLRNLPEIDQLRWIGQDGHERIRVERRDGGTRLVPAGELQNKSNRPYFSATIDLLRDGIYVSPIDLNIEHGEIERPLRPMLRVATPVVDAAGRRRGVVVVNLRAQPMLEQVGREMAGTAGEAMLIAANGEWIYHPRREMLWGGELAGRPLFSELYPRVWQAMLRQPTGTLDSDQGEFLYSTLSLARALGLDQHSWPVWRLAVRVPPQRLSFWRQAEFSHWALAGLLGLAGLGSLAGAALRTRVEQERRLRQHNERLLAEVFNAAPDAILLVDTQGRLQRANPRAEAMFGRDAAELLGGKIEQLMPERHRRQHGQLRADYMAAPHTRSMGKGLALFGLHADGTEFPIDVVLSPMPAGAGVIAVVRDISDAVAARDRLKTSEALLREILGAAGDTILVLDGAGRILRVNPQVRSSLGYHPDDLVGQPLETLLPQALNPGHPGLHPLSAGEPAGARRLGGDDDLHARHADGHAVPVEISLSPMHHGEAPAWVAVMRDVTQRKAQADALRASEERFRLISETLDDVFWITTPGLERILYVSPAYRRIWGQEPVELYRDARAFMQAVVDEDRPGLEQDLARLVELGGSGRSDWEWRADFRVRGEDGGVRWIHDRGYPVADAGGSVRYLTGIASDITELKDQQEALRGAETRNRLLLESVTEGIYGLDAAGRTSFVNPAAARMLGYRAEELIGAPMHETVHHSHPDGSPYPAEDCPIFATLQDGRAREIRGECFWRRDGGSLPVEYNCAPVWRDGRLSGAVVVFRDVTERVAQENLLHEALREKEVLLAEIHHRVKNNLQVIHSLLDLQSAYVQDPRTLAMLRDSQNRVRSMALIHQTLYQSRDFSGLNFSDYLSSIVGELAASTGRPGIEVAVEAEPIVLPLDTAIPCGLLVNELVSNAYKHAFAAGGAGHIRVGLSTAGEPSRVCLSVVDDGVGFDADRVLEADASLGLRLVHSLCEQIGGALEVSSRPGETRFTVAFPTGQRPPRRQPLPASA